jgi:hypothetical protein
VASCRVHGNGPSGTTEAKRVSVSQRICFVGLLLLNNILLLTSSDFHKIRD